MDNAIYSNGVPTPKRHRAVSGYGVHANPKSEESFGRQ